MKRKLIIFSLVLLSLFIVGCNSSDNYAKIPLSDVSNQVQFYVFDNEDVEINYFAVLGSDGKPRMAFDACDVCGGYKGYEQVGNDIRCRNCGRMFSIDGLGTKNKGYGCWPSYLNYEIKEDNILIKIDDIKQSRQRFA